MSLLIERSNSDKPQLSVLSRGIRPSVALYGAVAPHLGFYPPNILAHNGVGTIYPIHNRLTTDQKTRHIEFAGRLVCLGIGNRGAALDLTREVLKLAETAEVPVYVNGTLPEDLSEFTPIVFDGSDQEGFIALARHLRDPEQFPAETLTPQSQPYEQQGAQS